MHGVVEGLKSRVFGKEGFEALVVNGGEVFVSLTQRS
jgi:hypothetical protein